MPSGADRTIPGKGHSDSEQEKAKRQRIEKPDADAEMPVTSGSISGEVSINECRGILELRGDEWRMETPTTAKQQCIVLAN